MPKGHRGMRKKKESPTVDYEIEGEFDESGELVDWSAGTISVGFEQEDGSTKDFSYQVPANILQKAHEKKSIGPIVDYVGQKIGDEYADATGVRRGSSAHQAMVDNYTGIVLRGLDEGILKEIEELERVAPEGQLPESVESYIIEYIYPRIQRERDDYDQMYYIAGEVQAEYRKAGVPAPSREEIINDALGL